MQHRRTDLGRCATDHPGCLAIGGHRQFWFVFGLVDRGIGRCGNNQIGLDLSDGCFDARRVEQVETGTRGEDELMRTRAFGQRLRDLSRSTRDEDLHFLSAPRRSPA